MATPLRATAVLAWGSGEDGQLGMGGNEEKDWPHFVEALGPYAVTAVVAGSGTRRRPRRRAPRAPSTLSRVSRSSRRRLAGGIASQLTTRGAPTPGVETSTGSVVRSLRGRRTGRGRSGGTSRSRSGARSSSKSGK
ncbi:regulator of chromosome condensation3 [Zea mays]|uniref:Regulator of chromosome condensation3 n=1 Tax=Zea mays TaxID=4577 RepID=A0A1D6Q1E2_MAIZE|nr:regulator of chromosome condensation3 [Zea mays]